MKNLECVNVVEMKLEDVMDNNELEIVKTDKFKDDDYIRSCYESIKTHKHY